MKAVFEEILITGLVMTLMMWAYIIYINSKGWENDIMSHKSYQRVIADGLQ